ncbi:polyprenyl synthetase family protein [Antrihabitans cavernicola]|uniref:Polyprenyl synthetase family protein n=1 Tax=Antrihabitans cavernicola TaxID=2495913 RepID=A0A5A7S8B2_9NOCA|nr:polyprenyl synthetase family protein [Spelaeibacter cavernicola]
MHRITAAVAPPSPDGRGKDAEFAASVTEVLDHFFASRDGELSRLGDVYVNAVRELRSFVLRGGKRIRPTFAWLGWLGAGGDETGSQADSVLRACAAWEFIQACALIHDDVMDASCTRRGEPSVHTRFADVHRRASWRNDPAKFGESVAILLGDLALCWADDLFHEAGLRSDQVARATHVWSAMRTELIGGQLLDVVGEASADESMETAIRIDRYKTAAYTVEQPLHFGAALAGADPRQIRAFRAFGRDIGVAFQLRDDLLGVFGDPAVTGKPVGDDLRQGKRTVLLAVALRTADAENPSAAGLLRDKIGTELSDNDIADLREAVHELGAADDIEARIDVLRQGAFSALDAAPIDPGIRDRLHGMAWSATRRSL